MSQKEENIIITFEEKQFKQIGKWFDEKIKEIIP